MLDMWYYLKYRHLFGTCRWCYRKIGKAFWEINVSYYQIILQPIINVSCLMSVEKASDFLQPVSSVRTHLTKNPVLSDSLWHKWNDSDQGTHEEIYEDDWSELKHVMWWGCYLVWKLVSVIKLKQCRNVIDISCMYISSYGCDGCIWGIVSVSYLH